MRAPLFSLVLGSALLLGAGLAHAGAPPAEKRFLAYSGAVEACDDAAVLSKIQSRFAQKESEYWHSSLTIQSYDRVHQLGFRSEGKAFIPRRYCTARVMLSDHKYRQVSYQIEENLGMIGFGFGVDFCVSGLDRNLAYAPACRVVQH